VHFKKSSIVKDESGHLIMIKVPNYIKIINMHASNYKQGLKINEINEIKMYRSKGKTR
jgi:hypothetical protein